MAQLDRLIILITVRTARIAEGRGGGANGGRTAPERLGRARLEGSGTSRAGDRAVHARDAR